VPYGVDLKKFSLSQREKKSDKFIVIFVGKLSLNKGIPYLLDAWNNMDLPRDKAELWIVGSQSSDVEGVLKRTPIADNVVFHGPVSQEHLISLYGAADLFVLPSIDEGLAMVQVEAMASGLPIVGTVRTGAAELINEGEHGFIIPTCDADALSERILWCYANRDACSAMGQAAATRAQQFSWDRYGDRIADVYKKIIGGA